MNLRELTIKHLKEQRQTILNGGVNCIPSPFTRFRQDFPGIQRFYYVVTGATKSSKTQITNYLFVFTPILFWAANPTKIAKPKIFYFPLEEDRMSITLRFYSFLLFRLKGIFISPTDLESIDERKPLSEEVLKAMDEPEFRMYADLFEECVEFREERNPTGMYIVVEDYMKKHGTIHTKEQEVVYKDELGIKHTELRQVFDYYTPNDPNQYVISLVDHAGLISLEKDTKTLKDAIELHSSRNIILRNRFGVTPILVMQQNSETTNLEAFKAAKIRPTKDGLKDSKRPGEDASCLIGITNPRSFDLQSYLGYDLSRLKDSFRVLEIVLNRKGIANGLCPLYFDGAICRFEELPLPNDSQIEQMYAYAENIRQRRSTLMFMYNLSKLFGRRRFIHYLRDLLSVTNK